MANSVARAENRFRQLCTLGQQGETVVPALLAELHDIVTSLANNFFFADAHGDPCNIYNEHTDYPMALYAEVFYERRDREIAGLAYSEACDTEFGVRDAGEVLGRDPRSVLPDSEIYNLIARPLGYGPNFLRMFVRDGSGRRPLGCVNLYPAVGARAWTAAERRRLTALEPFFAHALTADGEVDDRLTDSGRRGVIVADESGKPLYLSAMGRHLLLLATHPRFPPGTAARRAATLPAPLARICRSLARVAAGAPEAVAPLWHHRNVWGGFRFRAEWLDGGAAASGRIAIAVTHEEPLAIRLARSVRCLPLTPRQAEVCLLLALGQSRDAVAERLAISPHTAIEHARWIYDKLDVHTRAGLVALLLSTEPEPHRSR